MIRAGRRLMKLEIGTPVYCLPMRGSLDSRKIKNTMWEGSEFLKDLPQRPVVDLMFSVHLHYRRSIAQSLKFICLRDLLSCTMRQLENNGQNSQTCLPLPNRQYVRFPGPTISRPRHVRQTDEMLLICSVSRTQKVFQATPEPIKSQRHSRRRRILFFKSSSHKRSLECDTSRRYTTKHGEEFQVASSRMKTFDCTQNSLRGGISRWSDKHKLGEAIFPMPPAKLKCSENLPNSIRFTGVHVAMIAMRCFQRDSLLFHSCEPRTTSTRNISVRA